MAGRVSAREVDEAALDVGGDEAHLDAVADVEAVRAAHELPSTGGLEDAHPGALLGGAGDDGRRSARRCAGSSSSAAADLRTCRSTLSAASSCSRAVAGELGELLGRVGAAARPASAALSSRWVIRSG